MNLGSAFAADVGHQAIFVFAVVQADGLGGLVEQIDDRRTAEYKVLLVNAQTLSGCLRQEEQDIDRLLGTVQVQLLQIDKKKFLRKAKIFL